MIIDKIRKLNLPPGVEDVFVELVQRQDDLRTEIEDLFDRVSDVRVDMSESLNHSGMH